MAQDETEKKVMVNFLLAFLSVTAFCICAHLFAKAIIQPLPRLNETGFSRSALRLKRQYQIFALGVMTFAFMISLVISFIEVYVEL